MNFLIDYTEEERTYFQGSAELSLQFSLTALAAVRLIL